MKINTQNETKINAAIAAAEGQRVSARTIDHGLIKYEIVAIEHKLSAILKKSDWKGLVFRCDPNAQSFPSAYNGTPQSTQFRIERGANAWFLTSVGRAVCNGTQGEIIPVNIDNYTAAISDFVNQSKNWT